MRGLPSLGYAPPLLSVPAPSAPLSCAALGATGTHPPVQQWSVQPSQERAHQPVCRLRPCYLHLCLLTQAVQACQVDDAVESRCGCWASTPAWSQRVDKVKLIHAIALQLWRPCTGGCIVQNRKAVPSSTSQCCSACSCTFCDCGLMMTGSRSNVALRNPLPFPVCRPEEWCESLRVATQLCYTSVPVMYQARGIECAAALFLRWTCPAASP